MRRGIVVFVVICSCLLSPFSPATVVAQAPPTCDIDNAEFGGTAVACRVLRPESGLYAPLIDSVSVLVFHFANDEDSATTFAGLETEYSLENAEVMPTESDDYVHYHHGPGVGDNVDRSAALSFILDGRVVIIWGVEGNYATFASWIVASHEQNRRMANGEPESYLPTPDTLPNGFVVVEEEFAGFSSQNSSTEPEEKVTRSPRSSDNSVGEPTPKVSRTTRETSKSNASNESTNTSTNRSSASSSDPIDIIEIGGQDAGIGDGTVYIYVDIKNTSGEYLSYVQVDITCRDVGGSVVSTGIANIAGLAPGESTVLTGILLQASGCETVDVKVNPLTG